MEVKPETEKPETIREKVDRIINNPMSEADFNQQAKLGKTAERGTVVFMNKNEFVDALKYAQIRLPWLSNEWVDYTIEHEDEHIDEARKRLGDRAVYKYKLQAILMNNGNLGIAGGFEVVAKFILQSTMDEHAVKIVKAPKELSESDKIATGVVIYD